MIAEPQPAVARRARPATRAKSVAERVRQPTEIRRGLIVEAARVLIAERGLLAASMRDIAARAEVSLGTVSYHFTGIAELLAEVLQSEMDAFYRPITVQAAAEPDGRLALLVIVDGFFADDVRTAEHWRLWLNFWALSAHDQFYAEWQATVYRQWRTDVLRILERGKRLGSFSFEDIGVAATEFMAVFDGWAAQAFLPRGEIGAAKARALLHDYVARRLTPNTLSTETTAPVREKNS